ncbi:hypothetical protein QS257_18790 [Terrilactibacillus sp. S3-3]|nr:hypothetical protein QS257_18790 [Terrilactibacillus sp. S3-3]
MIHVLNDAIDYEVLFQLAAGQGTEFRVYHTLSAVYHQFPHLEKLLPLPKSGTEWSMAYLEETIDETFPLVTKYHRLAAAEI